MNRPPSTALAAASLLCGFAALLFTPKALAIDVVVPLDGNAESALRTALQRQSELDLFEALEIRFQAVGQGTTVSINSALPPITALVRIDGLISRGTAMTPPTRVTFRGPGAGGNAHRLATVDAMGELVLANLDVTGFGAPSGNGGALLVNGMAELRFVTLRENRAPGFGGAVAAGPDGFLLVRNALMQDNVGTLGGAGIYGDRGSIVWIGTESQPGNLRLANRSGGSSQVGAELYLEGDAVILNGISFLDTGSSASTESLVYLDTAFDATLTNSSFTTSGGDTRLVDVAGNAGGGFFTRAQGSVFGSTAGGGAASGGNCQQLGTREITSFGNNVNSDSSCFTPLASDQVMTNPQVASNAEGLPAPVPGSPVIDAGASEAILLSEADDAFAHLPCGHVDALGTGRPQDANNDGVYECDLGAIEVPGPGRIEAGHSASYFNVNRNGEGNFVEILDENTAVVYTFSYDPTLSSAAWMVGLGRIVGNSIIVDDLERPFGAIFGPLFFDPNAVVRNDVGSMSLVFNDCLASGDGGSVAYTGEVPFFTAGGFEGLLTRARRLSRITGCDITPTANAGLSGSWYDPARDGEGIVVQWLESGEVLVILYTYPEPGTFDPGLQRWITGTGRPSTPDGKTVTIDALYPVESTRWGRNFDADEIRLAPWGTFTLTWSDCNNLEFSFNSNLINYGSGTYQYQRLTRLAETECPDF